MLFSILSRLVWVYRRLGGQLDKELIRIYERNRRYVAGDLNRGWKGERLSSENQSRPQ